MWKEEVENNVQKTALLILSLAFLGIPLPKICTFYICIWRDDIGGGCSNVQWVQIS